VLGENAVPALPAQFDTQQRWWEVVPSPALLSPSFNMKAPRAKHDLIQHWSPTLQMATAKDGLWDCSDAFGYKDIESKHEEC